MITVFKHQRYNHVMKRRMSLYFLCSNVNRHAGRTSVAVPGLLISSVLFESEKAI